ncbi:MAG TPA: universal stress protein [Xanthomonadaceae bacterium]|nr:universal stress protein [Xanthomonadaceae bacterium]
MNPDILVHATGFAAWTQSLRAAVELAARLQSPLTALYVCEPPIAVALPDASAVAAALAAYASDHREAARARASEFERWARERGVAEPAWRVAEGHVADMLGYVGNWHDLLVLGRSETQMWQGAGTVGQLVVDCALPCLVVPESETAKPLRLERAGIGWNGSIEATRAVQSALPLLQLADSVTILDGRHARAGRRVVDVPELDLQAHLARHGIEATVRSLETSDSEAGAALLDECASLELDWLVMGAYGRTRLREWILGGATRELLADATVPVFMRH